MQRKIKLKGAAIETDVFLKELVVNHKTPDNDRFKSHKEKKLKVKKS